MLCFRCATESMALYCKTITAPAAVAVGHSILVIIYHLLRDRGTYHDLGGTYFDEHDRQMVQTHLVRRLERLGYQVDLQPRSEAG